MARTQQEQVQQVGRYVVLLETKVHKLRRRLVGLVAAFFTVLAMMLIATVTYPSTAAVAVGGVLASGAVLLLWRTVDALVTTIDRLLSLTQQREDPAQLENSAA